MCVGLSSISLIFLPFAKAGVSLQDTVGRTRWKMCWKKHIILGLSLTVRCIERGKARLE